ncbi:Glycosyltransferase involved in cell wall biosynthesis [Planctomycetales bacterium 10988]|nr:Glycosyltransferase involved in cell wall biosynthesis [Planctomycetales bacterium 10988]
MEGWQTEALASSTSTIEQQVAFTVLLPTFNEELAIVSVLEEIVNTLADEERTWEILIVDDASTDATVQLARKFAAECWQTSIRILERPENGGAGAARKTGIKSAQGEIIVMLDADGTYPAEHIKTLLSYFPQYDQVNGARTSEQGTLPYLRVPAKWFIRQLACYLTGKKIPDLNTGLKAFKRETMLPWIWVIPDGFSCVTTMTLAFLTNGHPVKYVPTSYRPRIGKSKFHPIHDTFAYLGTVLRIVMYFRPLKIFLPLSGLMIFASVIKSAFSFSLTGSMQESDLVMFTAGFMTCIVGLLAEVVVAHHRR